MTVFADASAVAKLFVAEAGRDQVAARAGPFAVSALTRVEVTAAIWMKQRIGALTPSQSARLARDWAGQLTRGRFSSGADVSELAVNAPILASAVRLCGVHALRAGDAIQLATALAVRAVDPGCTGFRVFDVRLGEAAATEGFSVLGA